MNHLPRFFGHSKRGKDRDSKKNPRRPRLERRNAAKHIEYDAASSSSSFTDSSGSLYTQSLELSHKTSFRVEGLEGEFDRICRSLGLSGPEDFAIPTAAWEAMKVRSSSDLLPRSKLLELDSLERKEPEEKEDSQVICELADRFDEIATVCDETELAQETNAETSGCCDATSSVCKISAREGIKGVRPPVLKPPSLVRLPAIDDACSTWDIAREFAQQDEVQSSMESVRELISSSKNEEIEIEVEKGEGEKEVERGVDGANAKMETEDNMAGFAEIAALSDQSCSFTTSNDDDSSSTTSNFSPIGKLKRNITEWEKGHLLGRGSFGSVYEGIS